MDVKPVNWKEGWSEEAASVLEAIMENISIEVDAYEDYDVAFEAWPPGSNPKGSFVSMAIRRLGKQANGHPYSKFFSFGFYYECAYGWDEEYIERRIEANIQTYETWLTEQTLTVVHEFAIGDKERKHHPDAPSAKRGLTIKQAVKTDAFGEPIIEEIDPLS